jgi:hypothetical protein
MHSFWLLTLTLTNYFNFYTLYELHNINLKLCGKQDNKIDLLHPLVAPQLSGGWQHNYSTKTREASHANEQSFYLLSYIYGEFAEPPM